MARGKKAEAIAEVIENETEVVENVVAESETAPKENVVTEEQQKINMLEDTVTKLQEQLKQALALLQGKETEKPEKKERVQFLWQAEVADDNIVSFGDGGMYGRIVGKTGSFFVPKDELSRVLDATNRMFLKNRWLIVIDGLDEEEREALDVNYKEGELIDEKMFRKIATLSKDELLRIFPALCDAHKEIVAKRLYEAYLEGQYIERDLITSLNRIESTGAFKSIIEKMNAEDLNQGDV